MTEQQIEMAKKLMMEYGLSAESPENTLLYLGLGYGLSEDAIRLSWQERGFPAGKTFIHDLPDSWYGCSESGYG